MSDAKIKQLLVIGIVALYMILAFNLFNRDKPIVEEKMSHEDSLAQVKERKKEMQQEIFNDATEKGRVLFNELEWFIELRDLDYLYKKALADSLSSRITIERDAGLATTRLILDDDDEHYIISFHSDAYGIQQYNFVTSEGGTEYVPKSITIQHYTLIGKVEVKGTTLENRQAMVNEVRGFTNRFMAHSKK